MYVLTLNGVVVSMIGVIPIPRILGDAALKHVEIQKLLPKVFVKLLKALGSAHIQIKPNAVRFNPYT